MRAGVEYDYEESFDPDEDPDNARIPPLALSVVIASIWIVHAGDVLYKCREIFGAKGDPAWDTSIQGTPGAGGPRWDGVDGFDPARWQLWKTVFTEIINKPGCKEYAVRAAKVSSN